MQRYFIDESLNLEGIFVLEKDDNHHLVNVMRAQNGFKIEVVDNQSHLYLAQVIEVENRQAALKVFQELDQQVELPISVTIASGLTKNDKFDWLIQKATETGMSAFIPLSLKRDVVKWDAKKTPKRIERLEKIAKEAAEQSHRLMIPSIYDLMTLNQLFEITDDFDHLVVLYEETAKQGEHQALKQLMMDVKPGDRVLAVFGSEGGLDESEIQLLMSKGFKETSLGPRILRAETAPIYFLSAVSFALEIN
ncbi:16S rRNA (uracil(1498)-N(3))-methyltransferase [Aerococcaceae bacterium DSM 111176]|nr:16S rRNA (uracil(1498)-N(3))-methyltransferase [Aerococcaceae bacterium DSM 111176]